jgi:hypothetical protein
MSISSKLHFALMAILLVASPLWAQDEKSNDRGQGIVTQEQIDANKRMHDLLLKPTFITLRFAAIGNEGNENSAEPPEAYRDGDDISYQLILTNTLAEPIEITQTDVYQAIRPELFKDGDLVPYTKKAQEIVHGRDSGSLAIRSVPTYAAPGKEYRIELVRIKDWYQSLRPGHYQLSVRRQFVFGGDWVQSVPVTFEVLE